MLVYVAKFEMGCCGIPADIGDEVEWLLYESPGPESVRGALGGSIEALATWHYGGMVVPDSTPTDGLQKTRGTIRQVWDFYSRYCEMEAPGSWFSIEGSESVVPTERLPCFPTHDPPFPDKHDGWIVDLEVRGGAHVYPQRLM